MAAVAGDAENINKQARKMRTNWMDQEQACGKRPFVLGPSGGCLRRKAPARGSPADVMRVCQVRGRPGKWPKFDEFSRCEQLLRGVNSSRAGCVRRRLR